MRAALDVAQSFAYSRYATTALAMRPDERAMLVAGVDSPFDWTSAEAAIGASVDAGDGAALAATLRTVRRRAFVHTLLRDLSGRAGLDEVCANMTRLAETSLRAALALHHRALVAEHGEPRDEAGEAQELVVIGMGKLGGAELNVSSDIDIVFVYPEDGETDGRRVLPCREFFERLGRRVIAALHDITPEGYVFRVDVRLRPYGESGPLAVSFAALELYLVTQGRAWERYAWLKARPLTGARHDELNALVAPFVFRKYLDYDAYEGLREVHRQIAEQGKRKDYGQNVKLGPGGIREVEFVVQALQIVRGGREPELRVRGTLPALAAIGARGLLPRSAVDALRDAYVFLRNVEHRLQYRDDRQTQMLPAEPAEREALARAMGHDGIASFDAALEKHRSAVKTQFKKLFGERAAGRQNSVAHDLPQGQASDDPELRRLSAVWAGSLAADTAREALAAAGFADPAALLSSLERLRSSARYVQLPARSRERVDALVPQLLRAATIERDGGAEPQAVFQRLFGLLDAVSRRSAYLALLTEHPRILPQLAKLMGASQWAADFLTRHPILLDELIDPRALLAEPDWAAWRAELDRQLESDFDPERQMDVLRHFQHAQTFRLLAQDLAGTLTVERLADHLSALADVILAATLVQVWRHMQGPDADPAVPPSRFAIIGYGKLGGKELGYASDLDLVFIFDDVDDLAEERYTRLSRRLVTWLTTMTPAGQLYDVDLRLRPDGAKGLVSSSLSGFRRYERENAWTWEHQALTRARFVAGDAAIGAAFEEERDAILRLTRDRAKLATDIVDMRRRMYAGHPNATRLFDLKHDPGGMVDVEFAVQKLVLAHANEHPGLTRNLGNIALLRIAGELGLVGEAVALASADAYRDYRRIQHQVRLTGAPHARVDPAAHAERRAAVSALWVEVFGESWNERDRRG